MIRVKLKTHGAKMARAGDGKPRSEKRRATHRISKRVSADEWGAFQERARAAGFQNHQEFLSALILGSAEVTNIQRRDLTLILGHIGKIGSNINQIARRLNSGRINKISVDDMNIITEIPSQLDSFGRAIRDILK
ncbi:plasmid mobilization protein [Rhodobacter capsulatus]|uniref:plasmid mobilization protein n=1 Tax=Rhodobacter capsulatus TaxID=1061 RepID=UPI0003D33665|nr:plasmid mobilization relaxosome protein MobC [Rhodobacter capsulatus]ETD90855.1 mobilization protein [Rhodobacter capsulatus YW2]